MDWLIGALVALGAVALAWWSGRQAGRAAAEAAQIKSYRDTKGRINAVEDTADLPDDTVADRLRRHAER